ncbi:MAG: hypothetical protein QM752_06430 [Gammaproteobacteria bacterium]
MANIKKMASSTDLTSQEKLHISLMKEIARSVSDTPNDVAFLARQYPKAFTTTQIDRLQCNLSNINSLEQRFKPLLKMIVYYLIEM